MTLTIALLGLYIILTAGFQLLVHTCGGETTVTATAGKAEDPCGCGEMPDSDRCCTTQVVTVHLDDDQQASARVHSGPDQQILSVLAVEQQPLVNTPAIPAPCLSGASPPGAIPSHLLHCALLI